MNIKEKFSFTEFKYHNHDRRDILIVMENPKRYPISEYLTADNSLVITDNTIQLFNEVLEGKRDVATFSGNACYVEAHRDKTLVEMQFEMEEGAGYDSAEIETEDLRNLLILWRDKRKEYYETGTIPELQK